MTLHNSSPETRSSLPEPSPETSTAGMTEIIFFSEPASPELTSPDSRYPKGISPESPIIQPVSLGSPRLSPTSHHLSTAPVPAEPPDLSELPDTSVEGGGIESRQAAESEWSSLPEVVPGWEQVTSLERVSHTSAKLSGLIVLPSDNEGLEVAGLVPRPYAGLVPDWDGRKTSTIKHTPWIRRKHNRTMLAVSALVLVLLIAGVTSGIAVGVLVNKNNVNVQAQGSSAPSGGTSSNRAQPSGSTAGDRGGTPLPSGTPGPAGDAPAAPVAPTAPTGPAPPMLPTRTGFGVPTSFPEPLGGVPQASTCTGTTCPHMLAVAQWATPRVSTVFLFARGLDGAVWHRRVENQVWASEWESLGGTFVGPPAAVSIREGRVDVFGVWAGDRTLRAKTFQNGAWDREWTSLGGRCGSPPAVCSLYPGNLQVVVVDDGHAVLGKNTTDGHKWEPGLDGWAALGGWAATSVAMACTDSVQGGMRVDVATYGSGATPGMVSRRWTSAAAWEKGWGHSWGLMKGDPTVVSTERQVDFLGVGLDEAMWVRSWTEMDGYGKEVSLGGKFQSAVSAFATGSWRLDIFAVGTDARLKHLARMHGVWGTAWEDLGGYFHSAPKAVVMDVPTSAVTVFGVGPNGAIIHASFMVGAGYNWGPQRWYSDGGQISASWLRFG